MNIPLLLLSAAFAVRLKRMATHISNGLRYGVSMDRRRKEMKLNNLSAKKICRLISAGMVFSMLVITGILGGIMQDIRIFIAGGTLTLCAFFLDLAIGAVFGKRLSHFTSNLCRTLDNMIDGTRNYKSQMIVKLFLPVSTTA